MECKSMKELESALLHSLSSAVNCMSDMVKDEIDTAVTRYYESYDPLYYRRTGNLAKAPSRTGVKTSGNSAMSEVYMDTEIQYKHGNWSIENVISSADNGLHGGLSVGGNVSVWRLPMKEMQQESKEMWKKALSDAGFNIK